MTVKSRIALGLAALLLVIASLGGLSVWYFASIQRSVNLVSGSAYERLDLIQSLVFEAAFAHSQIDSAGGLDTRVDESRRSRFAKRLSEDAVFLFPKPISSVNEVLLTELKNEAAELLTLSTGRRDSSSLARMDVLLDNITLQLRGIYKQDASILEREIDHALKLSSDALDSIITLLAVCVAFALGVLVWLPRYVARPIVKFGKSLAHVAEGDYSTRLAIDRKDEFGQLALTFNLMAAELEKGTTLSRSLALESQTRLSALVNQLEEMILGMDAERRIVFINPAMAEYLKLDPGEALGKYMPDLALRSSRLQKLFQPLALGKSATIEPFAVEEPSGATRYLQQRVVRLEESGEAQEGDYIILLSDVTNYEQKTHEQTDYLASLSHEMKTPIAAISMSVNLLEDVRMGALNEDQAEVTKTIRHNVQRLLRMINEVLALAKGEAGAARLSPVQVDVPQLLATAKRNVAPLANDKRVQVDVVSPTEHYGVEADEAMVESAVNNLLTNAIRYSPTDGEITVTLSLVPGGARITVADQGPGVSPEQRERIFGRYRRASADRTEGTGLGLAISRENMEAHGGRLYLDAAYGPGACFVIELPRRLSQPIRAQVLAND